jgi:hypothetical protein
MEKLKFTGTFNAHQGDVQLHSIAKLPEGLKKLEKTFFAKSEKSGHAHALCGDYDLLEDESGSRFIVVGTDGATLNHTGYQNLTSEYWDTNDVLPIADHKPTLIPAGTYHVGIQRRVDPYKSVWEKVKD